MISVRGMTGAVVGLCASRGEAAEDLSACLRNSIPGCYLGNVRHIASDNPSQKMLLELRKILPNLEGLSLDPIHVAMHYEDAFGRRRTQGSRLLRSLMAKFNGYEQAADGSIWGELFEGAGNLRLSSQEEALRKQIPTGEMSTRKAKRVLTEVENLVVWPTRIQFIEAVAALSSTYCSDLKRKAENNKTTVGKILHQITSPEKVEWLFNNLRFRTSLPATDRSLLPTGTTSNEALHAELNNIFRQVQQMHRTTLHLKLSIIRLAKLMTHNSALYSPTCQQLPGSQILVRQVGLPLWTTQAWNSWWQDGQRVGEVRPKAKLRLEQQKGEDQERLKKSTQKKPASNKQHHTPFNLRRSAGVTRRGTYRRRPAAEAEGGRSG